MSCEELEPLLLEGSLEPLLDHPHVAQCEACADKLHQLLAAEQQLGLAIGAFGRASVDYRAAIERGVEQPPPTPRRTAMSALIQATALAATVALTASALTHSARLETPAESPLDSPCANIETLAGPALEGSLSDEQLDCLAIRRDSDDSDSTDASRLLLADAWAKGDKERWIHLAETHIDHVDRGDVDLLYKVALYASKTKDHARTAGSAERALGLAANWPLADQPQRIYNLWRLRVAGLAGLRAEDPTAQQLLDEALPAFLAAGEELGKAEQDLCLQLASSAELCD